MPYCLHLFNLRFLATRLHRARSLAPDEIALNMSNFALCSCLWLVTWRNWQILLVNSDQCNMKNISVVGIGQRYWILLILTSFKNQGSWIQEGVCKLKCALLTIFNFWIFFIILKEIYRWIPTWKKWSYMHLSTYLSVWMTKQKSIIILSSTGMVNLWSILQINIHISCMYVNNFAYVVGLNVVSCQVRTWLWCSGVHLWCVLSSAGPINQYSQYIQVMRLNQLSWSGSCALISLRCVHFLNGNCLHAKPIYLSRANISIQKCFNIWRLLPISI